MYIYIFNKFYYFMRYEIHEKTIIGIGLQNENGLRIE
jgi:hypothetical protein